MLKSCIRIIIITILVLGSYSHSQANDETNRVKKILATIPAANNYNVLKVIQINKINLKEGMIDNIDFPVNGSFNYKAGDTVMDIYFDVYPPKYLEISKGATTDLHAKFIKRKGTTIWRPENGWAKCLVNDKMPWSKE